MLQNVRQKLVVKPNRAEDITVVVGDFDKEFKGKRESKEKQRDGGRDR